ncbi:MAG: peptidoglycan DD-metalloendopeptidase family protein [Candidatus Pacebacteria bacterium]|nr:peptidoglycan DD-metalloendopeptidase family protein [Candidatus Paceibacterota bacterium]
MKPFLSGIHHRDSVINLKFRLILLTPKDSDSSKKPLNQKVKMIFRNLFVMRVVFALTFFGTPVSYAQAGALSFVASVTNLFAKEETVNEDISINSQNINLLQASVNFDPNPAKGGGDITIVGDVALLSETGPFGSMVDISEKTNSDKISVYVVREGDSLSQISKMFGVSNNTIIWANDLKNGIITKGQTLVILPVTGVRHTVKKGETLVGIANKYKGDIDEIKSFNNLKNENLAVGDIVIIPDGDMGSFVYQSSKTGNSSGKTTSSTSGYYIRPVTGIKTQGIHGYNAIDIGTPVGTSVVASASGKVIISRDYGWNGGYGSYIVIQHDNGTQTLYAHMSQNIVSVGQIVVRGQIIGYSGNTGKSTGPHLHFEIRGAKNPF